MIKGIKIIINTKGIKNFGILNNLYDEELLDYDDYIEKSFFYFYGSDYHNYKKDKSLLQKLLTKLKCTANEQEIIDKITIKMENSIKEYNEYLDKGIERENKMDEIDKNISSIEKKYDNQNYKNMFNLLTQLKSNNINFREYPETIIDYFDLEEDYLDPKYLEGNGEKYFNMLIQKYNPNREYDFILTDNNEDKIIINNEEIDIINLKKIIINDKYLIRIK